jgi:glycosyltransferase involved in cell wall biosynthesis
VLNILEIAHDHPSWTTGGTEFVAKDLTDALDSRSDVTARLLVAATRLQRPQSIPGVLEAIGRDFVLPTGKYDRFTMLRHDGLVWLESLERVLDHLRPDVIHLHGLDRLGAEILPVFRRLAPSARLVLTLHDYQLICPNDGLLLTTAEKQRCAGMQADRCGRCFPEITADRHVLRKAHLHALLGVVDAFIAPSRFLKARFAEWGLPDRKLHVIPNAMRGAGGAEPASPPGAGRMRSRRNRFAYFGNISQHKGSLVFLEAAACLRRRDADLRLDIHGSLGWSDAAFRARFDEGLANAGHLVQYRGPYERAAMPDLLAQTDWVVVPSIWWENAPLIIHEAKAAGRPVICSGVGGMAELVQDGLDGLHVSPGDAAGLAEIMEEASRDVDLWQRLAAASREKASFEAVVSTHLDLFQSLFDKAAA